ncbi:Pycsar system effector family protein [Ekhidna sp.]|uniref:Pycsar system effector family protein n=1 Tax=Ekhidna sp. TaxID=2608089 RepID=UPI003BAB3389
MNQKQEILKKAESYIQDIFSSYDEILPFHNIRHIEEVVEVASELGKASDLDGEELEVLLLVVWFYFSGFPKEPKKFISHSKAYLEDFCDENGYTHKEEVLLLLVEDQTSNSSKQAKLLHDSLISYKGRKRFFRKAELMRLERKSLFNQAYTEYDWEQRMFMMLVKCVFLTDAAKEAYRKRRIKNISKQRSRANKAFKLTTRKKTGKEFGRGIDTLYRANYNNQISLSSIADGKANMMISINTIILSVIVTLSGAGFTMSGTFLVDHLRFTVPVFILLIGSLISVVFAVISARPKVTNQELDMEMVEKNKSSLLFFGNYLQIPLQDYVGHLSDLKESQQKLYDSMSVDMYFLGKVLQTKYKWLTWSYNAFMIALILCVVSFTFIFFYTNA